MLLLKKKWLNNRLSIDTVEIRTGAKNIRVTTFFPSTMTIDLGRVSNRNVMVFIQSPLIFDFVLFNTPQQFFHNGVCRKFIL